jgi:hypothetical protein
MRRFHGGVYVSSRTLCNVGEFFACRRIRGVEILGVERGLPSATDEMAEAAAVAIEPGESFAGIFGRGAVVHGDEFLDDAHSVVPDSFVKILNACHAIRARFATVLREGMTIICRIPASGVVFELPFDVPKHAAGAKTEKVRLQPRWA